MSRSPVHRFLSLLLTGAGLVILVSPQGCTEVLAAGTVPLEKLTWRHRNPYPIGQGFAGFVAGDGCFIAYGGGGLILRSENGVFWDVVPVPFKGSFLRGKFLEGEFLLAGESYLYTSPDGWTWTARRLPQQGNGEWPSVSDVDRSGNRLAALANGGIYVSDNGGSWEFWPFTEPGGLNGLAIGPDGILTTKSLFPNTTLLTFTGPGEWSESPSSVFNFSSALFYVDGRFVGTGSHSVATSVDSESWEVLPLPADPILGSLTRSGLLWILVGLGDNLFFTSTDLVNWTEHACDAFSILGRVSRKDPGVWIATGDEGGIATSTDGENWVRRDSGIAPTMHAIARIADRWVAVGQQGTAITSIDGTTWEKQTISDDFEIFHSIIADENVLYARNDSFALTTTDGINWSRATSLPQTQWDFSGISFPWAPGSTPVWVGDHWLLPAYFFPAGVGALFSSTDGVDWTHIHTEGLYITSVAGRPGAYVATGGVSGLLVSSDAVTWENTSVEFAGTSSPTIVLEGFGWFLAGTSQGIIASPNGRDWEWLPGISSQINGGSRIGESFWFTGEGGTIIEVMPHLEAPLGALSTRVYQRSEGLPTIAGFYIEGNEPVDVLVRAVGVGLLDFDVDEVVEQPVIQLYKGQINTTIAGDWATSPLRAEIESATQHTGIFELHEDSGDAAVTARLTNGGYTAVVKGTAVEQGNVLVEIYDSGSTSGTSGGGRLAASSTRGEATELAPLIGGLVIKGTHQRRLLVRGIGPGLVDHGVPRAATDPRLTVYRGNSVIAENDEWEQSADPLLTLDAFATSGAFELMPGSLDAAIVLTLDPGLYTVHVSPAKGTAGGEVLLETYYLD